MFENKCCNTEDYGPCPCVLNVTKEAMSNPFYRRALWTGECLQSTLMCIPAGESIGMEIHENTDQLLFVISGNCMVKMGKEKNCIDFEKCAAMGSMICVPEGTWHNVINTGIAPLKICSVYAPPHHKYGTVQKTKCDAEKEE